MRTAFSVLSLLMTGLFALPASGAHLFVPSQFPSIQSAIVSSMNGDVIVVAPGTYVENIDFLGKAITVQSSNGPSVTTIDGSQGRTCVVRFDTGEGLNSVLEGFTLTGGLGASVANVKYGGGVACLVTSPTIRGNVITGNTADNGAGIGCLAASAFIVDNVISHNTANNRGGGIHLEDSGNSIIRGCTIEQNSASLGGGGISTLEASTMIEYNLIRQNAATSAGGGIHCFGESEPIIEFNQVLENQAGIGGAGGIYVGEDVTAIVNHNTIARNRTTLLGDGAGMLIFACSPEVRGNLITENESSNSGGGIYCWFFSDALIADNVISGNTGGGFGGGIISAWNSAPRIINNSIYGNVSSKNGGGVSVTNQSNAQIINNRITGNQANVGGGVSCDQSYMTLTNNTIHGNHAFNGGGGFTSSFATGTMTNNILWGNTSGVSWPEIYNREGLSPSVTYCNVAGGWPGTGNINQNPLFVNAPGRDFHLRLESPCVDVGDNSAPFLPQTDFEGDVRRVQGKRDGGVRVDLGADELDPAIAVRYGAVNATGAALADVLRINGSAGNLERVCVIQRGSPMFITVDAPPAGPVPASFVIYVWMGIPDEFTLEVQPLGLGTMSFSTPLSGGGSQPVRIWNNLRHYPRLGVPNYSSSPAPSQLIGLASGFPYSLTVTFQGFIQDHATMAAGPGSITNAVVLEIQN